MTRAIKNSYAGHRFPPELISHAGIVNLLGESRGLASLTANRGAVGYAASLMPQTSCHAWKARARSAR